MSELPTYEGFLPSLPATIMKLLGVAPPNFIPSPIAPIIERFPDVKRVIFIMIDNLGLFEITFYKPQFMIEKADALVLLSTKNPYTLGVLHQTMYGGFDVEPNGFHLLKALNTAGKETTIVGREKDLSRYSGNTASIVKDNDMATWIEAAKIINHKTFSFIHFLDFESLYHSKVRMKQETPEELIQKLITRTDKWILSLYKQARGKTLFITVGNHGRTKIDLNYQGKIADWRKASVPIAILTYKPEEK
jgi:hypothetical protein